MAVENAARHEGQGKQPDASAHEKTFICARCTHPYQEEDKVTSPDGRELCDLCADEESDLQADRHRAFTMILSQQFKPIG